MSEVSPKQRLAELVTAIARAHWQVENSITYKNRTSMPSDLRDAFIVLADMSGVAVLDSRGSMRVFSHDDAQELELKDWIVRATLRQLEQSHPELAELVRGLMSTST